MSGGYALYAVPCFDKWRCFCAGRSAVGEGGSVGSCVRMHVVPPDSMCCIYAYSVAPSVGTLVLRCWGFCMCLGICMVRAFGLQR